VQAVDCGRPKSGDLPRAEGINNRRHLVDPTPTDCRAVRFKDEFARVAGRVSHGDVY
jgi:hypothetical protein